MNSPSRPICQSCEFWPAEVSCHTCSFLTCVSCIKQATSDLTKGCYNCGQPWVLGLRGGSLSRGQGVKRREPGVTGKDSLSRRFASNQPVSAER